MSALNIVITDAGRAEHLNAQNTGAGPLEITAIQLGSGQYAVGDANKTQTELTNPIKSLTTFAGQAVADDTLHVSIKDETSDSYAVGEFGLFTASGTLYAIYSQAEADGWIIEKAAPSTLLLAVDVILDTLNASALSFGDLEFVNPPASETVPGVMKLATEEAIAAGIEDRSAVTPKGLQQKVNAYFPPGTRMLFNQPHAPTGWVQETDPVYHDRALRINATGNTFQGGGRRGFLEALVNPVTTSEEGGHGHEVTVAGKTLSQSQLPKVLGYYGYFPTFGRFEDNYHNDVFFTHEGLYPYGKLPSPDFSEGIFMSVVTVVFSFGTYHSHDHAATAEAAADHSHTTQLDVAYTDVIIGIKQ